MDLETKRVRRIRPTTASKVKDRKLIDGDLLDEYLTQIAENNEKLAQLTREQNDAMAAMFKVMRANKLSSWEVPQAKALIAIPQGRDSKVIQPREFYDLVSEEEFFGSIRVLSEKAKECLSKKELDKITDTTPGKPGAPRLDIEYR